jgi:nicotinate (nicotinamide) nucleotide adenylyltransferase
MSDAPADSRARRRPTLAVLGGSFNPPHLGHALLPAYLLARGEADRVLVAPCWDHPLGKSLVPFERRMSWVRLALAHHDERVEVSAIEAELARERDGRPSYTLELLEACAASHADCRVRLVVGSDITLSGETERWHRWDDIVERFDPIVVPRAGWSSSTELALPEISSTVVREQLERLRAGGAEVELARSALASMVPARVAAAIERWIAGDEPSVWVVGHGHVAAHVVPWLRDRGFAVAQIGARTLLERPSEALVEPRPAPAGVWLLGRDDALPAVARALVGRLPPGTPVLHAAGARLASEVLGALADAGHPVGTLHPICSLRRERARSRIARASFGVAGSPEARRFAAALAGDAPLLDLDHLDARGRLAYHAACALVANHLAVLEDRGAAILRGQGLDAGAADRALGELMLGSLENLLALGIPRGITGPLARGDRATVEAHLDALDDRSSRALYAELSERLAELL